MEKEIIAILTEQHPEFDFTENVDFFEEGILDSFDMVNLVVDLESKFKIKIDGVDVIPENFSTIENIINLLKSKGVQ